MKTRRQPALTALAVLWMSALACGLFTAPATDAPVPASPSNQPSATLGAASPTPAPLTESQPASTADALPTLAPAQDVNGDGQIGVCEIIPQAALETIIGRALTGPAQPFSDPALGEGCAYDFGSEGGAAYFAYVTIASEQQFTGALANAARAEPVTTLGDSAFLSDGPDARLLWVRVGSRAALVAIGDQENIPAAFLLARYLVAFIGG